MSRLTETRAQRLNVANPTQMEMRADTTSGSAPISEDFEGKLVAAQQQLEQLKAQQERIEQEKLELEELNERKEEFLLGQNDISDRLATSLTAIDRELFEMRQEMEDLEQTRQCFADHQQKIDGINPQSWTREELKSELKRAISFLDLAEDEYEEAMEHFKGGRRSGVFAPAKKTSKKASSTPSEFTSHFKQGFAFNLPLIIAAAIAYIIYFFTN
ncbi:hypothetical protein ACFPK9_13780 [Rubritalea spongiae]|uniref:Uncharacterized protein n=1 Tax=Rubritalea spongiae TaxID=430797 RepID=A0ABW5E3Z7_9BACT